MGRRFATANAARPASGRALREPGSARWDAIVAEDFAAPEDVTTLRLFGRGLRPLVNAVRIGRHVPTFRDVRTIETYLVEERVVR